MDQSGDSHALLTFTFTLLFFYIKKKGHNRVHAVEMEGPLDLKKQTKKKNNDIYKIIIITIIIKGGVSMKTSLIFF